MRTIDCLLWPRLTLMMQNAGVDLLKGVALEDSDAAKFRQVMDVNVMSAVLVRWGWVVACRAGLDPDASARRRQSG